MGRRRRGRPVNGILLLDKPTGLTSNQALQRVKRLFDASKAGHTGSLDPLASGLLPVCFGHATKVSAFLLDADKRYEVEMAFGASTTTGDAEGEITASNDVRPDHETLAASLDAFRGDIEQVPPMYSALKRDGQRLYKLARQGVEVPREPRPVTIHELELLACDGTTARARLRCSKGTYVRTLVEDIAKAVGALAHVTALRRTTVGALGPDGLHELAALEETAREGGMEALDALLLPLDAAIAQWPSVELGRDLAWYLMNGQPVAVPRAPARGWVRLYGENHRFIGMGEITADGRVAPRRLIR